MFTTLSTNGNQFWFLLIQHQPVVLVLKKLCRIKLELYHFIFNHTYINVTGSNYLQLVF